MHVLQDQLSSAVPRAAQAIADARGRAASAATAAVPAAIGKVYDARELGASLASDARDGAKEKAREMAVRACQAAVHRAIGKLSTQVADHVGDDPDMPVFVRRGFEMAADEMCAAIESEVCRQQAGCTPSPRALLSCPRLVPGNGGQCVSAADLAESDAPA